MARRAHRERHRTERIGWLRAAVLGANDGIVSIASLIVGVAAASAGRSEILVAGVAGMVAGAMSMAAGEFVSVSSQLDTERADVAREREELAAQPEFEKRELAAIYVTRGLTPDESTPYAVTPIPSSASTGKIDVSGPRLTREYSIPSQLPSGPRNAPNFM